MVTNYHHPWPVLIERGRDLWGIIVLGLPGCNAQYETLDEALARLDEVVDDHLEAMKDLGQSVPDPPPGPRFVKVLLDEDVLDEAWDEALEFEQWLKAPQAARLIGVSAPTVKRYIKEGRLPAYQPARDYLVRLGDVMSFIKSRRVGTSANEAA
ncbi:MAG: type II toxin-antitoxin system HicB family antitoxin [Proteobacteria bacterium]|nr:type II toxin-antitoxin system HicB family antitoxin [Pseudomonadota bacterium]